MHEPLALGTTMAGYRLLRRLGGGSHGTVYLAELAELAEHQASDKLPAGARRSVVALKVMPLERDDNGKGFLRQAQAAQRLHHPGIVATYAAGVEGGWAWLAMQPVPGGDLQRYTQASRLLPDPVVLTVAATVADALSHAHAQGVVHRDVKPANVLVHWPTRLVKLADFGLARGAQGEATQTGVLLGTPLYMSPEQLAGAIPTARSDTYALGVTLFQLLTGRLPHQGASMGELLQALTASDAPALITLRPELPTVLSVLLARMLDRRPQQRPAELAQVAAQLRTIAQGLGPVLAAPPATLAGLARRAGVMSR
jgi:eukaryotic-like serine/threonine-protein kinase